MTDTNMLGNILPEPKDVREKLGKKKEQWAIDQLHTLADLIHTQHQFPFSCDIELNDIAVTALRRRGYAVMKLEEGENHWQIGLAPEPTPSKYDINGDQIIT